MKVEMKDGMKKDNTKDEMERKVKVKTTGKKKKDKSIIRHLLAILVCVLGISTVIFINSFFKISERVYDSWLKSHGELREVVSGENKVEEKMSGEKSNDTKTEVKSSISGRVEADGYDESEISYKSYDGVKSIQNFELTNLKVGKINGSRCIILADTKNISKEFQKSIKVRISVIDENDEVKETFSAILSELAGLETGKFKAQVLSDVTYAKDFKIEVVNE